MITVRFPSGFSVQYNDLRATKWGNDGNLMLFASAAERDSGHGWLVHVPKDALVEFTQPCRTYQAASPMDADRLAAMEKDIRGLRRQIKAMVKKR